jgi:hypothetical protein
VTHQQIELGLDSGDVLAESLEFRRATGDVSAGPWICVGGEPLLCELIGNLACLALIGRGQLCNECTNLPLGGLDGFEVIVIGR